MQHIITLICTITIVTALQAKSCHILLIGDSISSGYGLNNQTGWSTLLDQRLTQEFPNTQLINHSISGYTSRNALDLLRKKIHETKPKVVIVEIGGNDGLRGISPASFRKNMMNIIELIENKKATPVILGVRLPLNLPEKYRNKHHNVYIDLLQNHYGTAKLLHEIAEKNMFQKDQIHPSLEAQPLILRNSYPSIKQAILTQPTCALQGDLSNKNDEPGQLKYVK